MLRFVGILCFAEILKGLFLEIYKSLFCLCLTIFVLSCIISSAEVTAQAPDSTDEKLKSELPERVFVTIIDTTMIRLVQRERFTDSVRPNMDEYLGFYTKERPWNLPDILTPSKFIISRKPGLLRDSVVFLTVYPSLPNALFYQGSLAGRFEEMDGLLYFNRHNLFDSRTENRGKYSVDNFRGVWNYHYGALTDLKLDVRYDAKNLGWLRFSEEENIQGITDSPESLFRKDIAFFITTFDWRQRFPSGAQSTVNFDFTTFRMDSQDSGEIDGGMDVGVNWGLTTDWPFMNPIDFGASVEYSIATDKYPDNSTEEQFWSPIFRLYLREKFLNLGAFNFRADAEAVGFREPETDVGNRTDVKFCPGVRMTTKLSDNLIFQLGGERTINRKGYAELYLYEDYIALNPFLKHPKTWSANTTLKLRFRDVNIEATGFAQIIDDLVFLNKTADVKNISRSVLGELSWTPDNLDAHIFGGKVKIDLFLAKGMSVSMQFIHEFQQTPGEIKHIPYRPQDIMSLNLSYSSSSGFGFNLIGEANGSRFYDLDSDDTLPPYFLWKMRLNKTLSQYITAFIGGQFSSGRYELLKGYELPQQAVDFGISLKF